ncbi:IclR family KDG regulon transcriptional repressor [Limimaricola variabilis]|uniref:IclR family KDG regulon transcriptional repressor n=1 Tax=Limimaricola variabilis TaxID=1492771 RepID=A0ABR6HSL9_9RHOB|nr:IclR family transcriptional regulator C-terminal domain-containing protein [Limimaricola variabilis]MBB3713553.1 IclR family KDG regulon transcriptional repressor [Limimaricola variabilis]
MPQAKTDNVASVMKVFSVLETLAKARRASLADLAQGAMTSKSTAHRLLQTMIDLGYVEQDPETEKYALTLGLFSLAARTINGHEDLLRVADRAMGRLARETGESVNLGVMDTREQRVVYIHQYDSSYSLSMKSTLGMRNPLHSTSLGKALLAWRDEEEIEQRIARMSLEPVGPRTITDPGVLIETLRETRARGYAEEIEESEAGVRCMAAPVFNHVGQSVAAISLSFPLFRFEEARKPDYVRLLRAASQDASQALGYAG